MKLNKILENILPRPKAILILGTPGCGKTEWLEGYLSKKRLFDITNLNISNFSNTDERSIVLENCLKNKRSFVYEGIVLKEDRVGKFINKLKSNDYRIYLVYFLKNKSKNIKISESIFNKLNKKTEYIYSKFKDKVYKVIEVK